MTQLPRIDFFLISDLGQWVLLEPQHSPYVMGRGQEVDIPVPDSLISRRHAELHWDEDLFWTVHDCGSRNGTVLNGRRIEDNQQLLDRARLQLGGQIYTYVMTPPGTDPDAVVAEVTRPAGGETLEWDAGSGEEDFTGPAFAGQVDRYALLDLVQFFKLTQRSGRLDLSGEPAKSIWFEQGAPADADFGDLDGEEALFAIFGDNTEHFQFHEGEASPQGQRITATPDQILMDLAMAQDHEERDQQVATASPPRSIPRPPTQAMGGLPDVDRNCSTETFLPVQDDAGTQEMHNGSTTALKQSGSTTSVAKGKAKTGRAQKQVVDYSGQQFGDVILDQCIGRGCMAQVYRGHHALLEQEVAVKIMMLEGGERDEHNRQRFLREARAAAKVRHQNVTALLNVGLNDDGVAYQIMELVDGQSLGGLIGERGCLSPEEVVRYGQGIAAGLAAIHREGIVHRDIKPDNILVSNDSMAKIADLGLARIVSDRTSQALTGASTVLGTPVYMAPETLRGSHQSGPEVDVYSFGITCYHLLAGSPPFSGRTPFEIVQSHAEGRAVPITDRVPDCDARLGALIHRCMDKDPHKRPTAEEVARELEQLDGQLEQGAPNSDRHRSHVVISRDFRHQFNGGNGARWWVKVLTIGVIVLLAIAVGVVVVLRRG